MIISSIFLLVVLKRKTAGYLEGIILANVLQHLISSRKSYENAFRIEEKKMRKLKNYKVSKKTKLKIANKIRQISKTLKFKIVIFIIIEFSLMLFFYYFVTAFCEVYKNTQISWLSDSCNFDDQFF